MQEDILDSLNKIETTGSFAAFAYLPLDFLPRISVQDVGEIQLPLCEDQARQIIAKLHQAPYGKGSETLVDTSVRNTWELDPSTFFFEDPQNWDRWINHLKKHLATKLGIPGLQIQADLYKMLIYEKGAMFKSHTE